SWEIGIVIAILVFFVFARVIFALYSLLAEELDILIEQEFYTFINLVVFPVMTFLGAFFSNMLMKIKIREGR
ncbi:MAG: hypothetical protein K6G62_07415, partial [Eubacterium sp.]|nr:hypothetical protein [Eubacterium sp.]